MAEDPSDNWLVEQRVAQLEEISHRRNVLLRQMYRMLQRKHDIGTPLPAEDDDVDVDGVNAFLERFDLAKDPETSSIVTLSQEELDVPIPTADAPADNDDPESDDLLALQPTEDPEIGALDVQRTKPPPNPYRLRPAQPEDQDSDRDELDFLSTPPHSRHRTPSQPPVHSRSASRPTSRPPPPGSPVAIDISDSSPPPPEIIDVDADEVEKRDSPMEVYEVDVEERAVSEAKVQVTNADTSENEVMTEDIEEIDSHAAKPSEMQDPPILQDVGDSTAQAQPLPPHQLATSPNNETPDNVASPVAIPVENTASHPTPAVVSAEGSPAGEPLTEEHQPDRIQPPPAEIVAEPATLQTEIPDTQDSHANHEDVEMEDAQETPTDPASLIVPSQPAQPVAVDSFNVVRATEPGIAEVPPQATTISPAALFMPPIVERRRPPHILRGIRSPALENLGYVFEPSQDVDMGTSDAPASDPTQYHTFDPQYTLPPLKSLPAEYQRKGKLTKAQRKRDKEKREREKDGSAPRDALSKEDNWTPLGLNRWAAVLNANPLYTKVSRATKCLLTKDWGTAFTELRLIKTFNHIENLKDGGRWSFRQPKKQRGVGGLQKTHWDYLMDEMKWMRTDFREERRWKLALAYNLSTAVLEWHAAGDTATRIANGICMKWRPPRSYDRAPEEEDTEMVIDDGHPLPGFTEESAPGDIVDAPEDNDADSQLKPMNPLSILNYNSDDDDDDDQDQDQGQEREQSVADALETSVMIDDALDAADVGVPSTETGSAAIQPKTEEVEDSSALQARDAMAVDSQDLAEQPTEQQPKDQSLEMTPIGLKTDSANPTLMSTTTSRSSDELSAANSAASKAMLKSIYAPIRERIAYSELDKLFLDFDDLDIARDETKDPAVDELDPLFPPSDLASVFPDFQPYGLFDVPSPIFVSDGKKKSEKKSDRDDPNKRAEDTTYSKLVPIGKFMHCKPTLLGPLQPSKKWKNGEWVRLDDYAISAEEMPASKPVDIFSGLFGSNKPVGTQTMQLPKDRRATEIVWTSNEDALLKSLTERYPSNWALIAECFNSARITLSTDKRTARDCFQRYDALLGSGASLDGAGVPMTPTTQMTTRGVKRLASVSAASSSMIPNASEPRKRRRHALVHDAMRKLTRQRLATAQKNALAQRKPLVVHDTHSEYNKLPKMSPAELGRLKAEKEARLNAEQAIVKRKQEELRMQQMQRMQMATANGQPAAVPHQQQVGIAQHQRISTPVSANSRLSPQQVAQAQAHLQQRNLLQGQQAQPIPTPQVPAQVSQVPAQSQPAIQAPTQNGVQAVNGAGTNGTPPQIPQNGAAATAHATYASPPRSAGTPANAVPSATSPRPPSAQAQAALLHATQMQQAVQMHQQATARSGSNIAYYMTPSGTPYTAEQINAMRVQLMQHQVAQAAQAQAQQQQQQQGAGQGS
ncbi:chromatin modification- protein VID21 [Pleurotus pulmonarius]|nr:chromatin modification- protein VID21 [Pleurotus pulmonarius]